MRKHGPDLTNKPRHLVPCPACNGHGQRRGVFYDIDCDACGAAGFVDGATGLALEQRDAVVQLRMWVKRLLEEQRRQATRLAREENNQRAPAAPTSEATEMNIKALEFLMEQYGLWVWSDNGTPRGSSPMLALMKRNPANEKRFAAVIPCISDDRALQVDRFLARLYDEDRMPSAA